MGTWEHIHYVIFGSCIGNFCCGQLHSDKREPGRFLDGLVFSISWIISAILEGNERQMLKVFRSELPGK